MEGLKFFLTDADGKRAVKRVNLGLAFRICDN